jgi:hypothetical protein
MVRYRAMQPQHDDRRCGIEQQHGLALSDRSHAGASK